MAYFEKLAEPLLGEKITVIDGKLKVPDCPIVPFIEGDGVGSDVWNASKRVFDAAVDKAYMGKKKIVWFEVYAGEKAKQHYDTFLPNDTLNAIKEYIVAIKGPLTTPVGKGIRSINVSLRQELDLYVCLRPIKYLEGVPSPVKNHSDVDIVIFRENSEDIYAGIEWEAGLEDAKKVISFLKDTMGVKESYFTENTGIGVKIVSKEGTKRLIKAAIEYALANDRKVVTIVHKGNIMKYTEGAFRNWAYEVAKEYEDYLFSMATYEQILKEKGYEEAEYALNEAKRKGKLLLNDVLTDAFLQHALIKPKEYSVIATLNLNGDYISDALAAQVGGIGLAPGANINYETCHAIFEATHGTAPKYAGLDKVNPSSMILSGVLMLEYIGWKEAASLIAAALNKAILKKHVTYDLCRLMDDATEVKCSEFANCIIENL